MQYAIIYISIISIVLIYLIEKDIKITVISSFFLLNPLSLYWTPIIHYEDRLGGAKPYFMISHYDVFALFFIIIIFIHKLKGKKEDKRRYFIIVPFVFMAINFISIFYSINNVAAFYESLRIFKLFIFYLFFIYIFKVELFDKIKLYLGITVLYECLLAIMQIYLGRPIGLKFLGEGNVFRSGVSGLASGAGGTFAHPNAFAAYSMIILIILLINYKTSKYKKLDFIFIIVSTFNIIISFSRTSIALMLILYVFYIMRNYYKNIIVCTFVVLGSIVIGLFFLNSFSQSAIFERFFQSDALAQANNRFIHYEIAFEFIKQKPLLGYGSNNYADLMMISYPSQYYTNFFYYNPIHNVVLLQCVQIGIIGAFFYVIFLLRNFFMYFKDRKLHYQQDKIKNIMLSGVLVSLFVLISGISDWIYIKDQFIFLIWIINSIFIGCKNAISIKR